MSIQTVSDLIEVLKKCDPNMPVATHANNFSYIVETDRETHGRFRVALLETRAGPHVIMGDIGRRMLNYLNYYVVRELDEDGEIPENWGILN